MLAIGYHVEVNMSRGRTRGSEQRNRVVMVLKLRLSALCQLESGEEEVVGETKRLSSGSVGWGFRGLWLCTGCQVGKKWRVRRGQSSDVFRGCTVRYPGLVRRGQSERDAKECVVKLFGENVE